MQRAHLFGRPPVGRRPGRRRWSFGGGGCGGAGGAGPGIRREPGRAVSGRQRRRRGGRVRRRRFGTGAGVGDAAGGSAAGRPGSPRPVRRRAWGGCPAPAGGRTPPRASRSPRGSVTSRRPARSRPGHPARRPRNRVPGASRPPSRRPRAATACRQAAPGQPDRLRDTRQRHRNHGFDAEREHLLCVHAVPPETGQGRHCRRVHVVQLCDLVTQRRQDVMEHGLVEVDPAQVLDPLGPAEQIETRRRSCAAPPRRTCRRRGRRRPPGRRLEPSARRVQAGSGLPALRCTCRPPQPAS